MERETPKPRRSSRKKRKRNPVKHGASRALLSCLCTAQLSDIIFLPLPGGVSGELPPLKKTLHPSSKSPLCHVSVQSEAPGIPLRLFPWSLGSSLCHVAQSELSLGRITQLSMGGQMTIIRLHSSGLYLKREERSPGVFR